MLADDLQSFRAKNTDKTIAKLFSIIFFCIKKTITYKKHRCCIHQCLARQQTMLRLLCFQLHRCRNLLETRANSAIFGRGSVLLSYLTFSGIVSVIEEYVPDHIIYPSLHNQSLVNDWLEKTFR
jgi:hypothetical protein